jgi:hypothetical protein
LPSAFYSTVPFAGVKPFSVYSEAEEENTAMAAHQQNLAVATKIASREAAQEARMAANNSTATATEVFDVYDMPLLPEVNTTVPPQSAKKPQSRSGTPVLSASAKKQKRAKKATVALYG